MQYLNQEGKIVYTSRACPGRRSGDGKLNKIFPALEWLANLCSHIPNRGEQMVRYYGHYSNVSRGKRQKEGRDDAIPCILEPEGDAKVFRRNWARLIQKIYEVDPLVCPKCQGAILTYKAACRILLFRESGFLLFNEENEDDIVRIQCDDD